MSFSDIHPYYITRMRFLQWVPHLQYKFPIWDISNLRCVLCQRIKGSSKPNYQNNHSEPWHFCQKRPNKSVDLIHLFQFIRKHKDIYWVSLLKSNLKTSALHCLPTNWFRYIILSIYVFLPLLCKISNWSLYEKALKIRNSMIIIITIRWHIVIIQTGHCWEGGGYYQ